MRIVFAVALLGCGGAPEAPVAVVTPVGAPSADAGAAPAPTWPGPFNSAVALEAIQKIDIQRCQHSAGEIGVGRAVVHFLPDGSVSKVTIEGPPFAGNATGGCIAGRLRGAHMPPFIGDPTDVTTTVEVKGSR